MSREDILNISRPAFFACDIQERFRAAIYQFPSMVATSRRLVEFARLLNIPVFATEQNPRALGSTVSELGLDSLGPLHVGTFPKTKFSMFIPEVEAKLHEHTIQTVILFGIESHICVLQSGIELIQKGYSVYVVADAVSSCNKEEIPIALARLRQAGAYITTSESLAFQLMGDAGSEKFKAFSTLVKAEKEPTAKSLRDLVGDTTGVKSVL